MKIDNYLTYTPVQKPVNTYNASPAPSTYEQPSSAPASYQPATTPKKQPPITTYKQPTTTVSPVVTYRGQPNVTPPSHNGIFCQEKKHFSTHTLVFQLLTSLSRVTLSINL